MKSLHKDLNQYFSVLKSSLWNLPAYTNAAGSLSYTPNFKIVCLITIPTYYVVFLDFSKCAMTFYPYLGSFSNTILIHSNRIYSVKFVLFYQPKFL